MGWDEEMEAVFFFSENRRFFHQLFSHLGFVMHGRYHQQIFLSIVLGMCLLLCVFSSFFLSASLCEEICHGLITIDHHDMDVSQNRGTPKSSHFNRVFHYKPSILGFPYFWKHPYLNFIRHARHLNQSWAQRL